MREDLEKKLDQAISYLTTDGSVQLEDVENLLAKRLPELTIDDVRARYPDLKIISGVEEAATAVDVEVESATVPPTPEPPKVDPVQQLRGQLRQQLVLKDLLQARQLLANLEPHADAVADMEDLRLQVEALAGEIEEARAEISRLENTGKYYELQERIEAWKLKYAQFPGLDNTEERAASKIAVAEKHLTEARTRNAGKDKVDCYLRALEACKDCREAVEALSLLPPDAPTHLRADIQPGSIALSWNPSPSGLGVVYRLLKKKGSRPQHMDDGEVLIETVALHFDDQSPVPGESFAYAVFAVRAGVASKTAGSTEPLLFIAELTELVATEGNEEVALRWRLPENAKGVEIYRSLNSPPSRRMPGEVYQRLGPVEEFVDKDVHNELTYGYLLCVVFEDVAGLPVYSGGVRLRATPISPPEVIPILEATIEGELITLEWQAVPEAKTLVLSTDEPISLEVGTVVEEDQLSGLGTSLPIAFGTNKTNCEPQRTGSHYFTAFSVANGMAVVGASASTNFIPALIDPQVIVSGSELFLEWEWPPHSEWVRVEYSHNRYSLEDADYDDIIVRNINRKDYDYHQGFVLKNVERKPYFFRLFSLPDPEADRSSWAPPVMTAIDNSEEIDIKYQIRISRNLLRKPKAAHLHITCDHFEQVPPMQLLYAIGGIPGLREEGILIMKVGRYELSGPDVQVKIPTEFIGPNRYAQLFFEDDEAHNLRLRMPKLEKLQLF